MRHITTFQDFNLVPELMRAIEELGFSSPTPIQSQAIPIILEGKDVLAAAQTGTGKTAGFSLPLLHNLAKKQGQGAARCLILTPTRELATQITEHVRSLGKYLPLRSIDIFGGVDIFNQIKKLRRGVDVIIATPGRLLDLVGQKAIDLSKIETLVLDEADRMLDMGFIHDIKKIIGFMPKKRQSLLFSATFSESVKKLAATILHAPELIQVAAQNSIGEGITEMIHPVDTRRKQALLSHLITEKQWEQVLVFVRTKHGADRLTEQLVDEGISATAIHGNKTQAARSKALGRFKKGSVQVLVATDVAARGLDIDLLPYVVNFDLPSVAEDYVHRVGRTGRAGNKGSAISLVSPQEYQLLRDIERLLKREIPREEIADFAPEKGFNPQPKRGNFQNRRRPQQRQRPASYGRGRPQSRTPGEQD